MINIAVIAAALTERLANIDSVRCKQRTLGDEY